MLKFCECSSKASCLARVTTSYFPYFIEIAWFYRLSQRLLRLHLFNSVHLPFISMKNEGAFSRQFAANFRASDSSAKNASNIFAKLNCSRYSERSSSWTARGRNSLISQNSGLLLCNVKAEAETEAQRERERD